MVAQMIGLRGEIVQRIESLLDRFSHAVGHLTRAGRRPPNVAGDLGSGGLHGGDLPFDLPGRLRSACDATKAMDPDVPFIGGSSVMSTPTVSTPN
jgi:hypothetical protein